MILWFFNGCHWTEFNDVTQTDSSDDLVGYPELWAISEKSYGYVYVGY